ncbi:MAG: hypothetical protein A2Y62_18910 [Candidatus Fischerbacteria bacterium RBG_13_37_8]|uniref:MEMO1 family protein A2Y62_18910 n=1 Tax=Candidatus Fischerbacteria bacterium RBG_13_37_8 TaxID=1817863 RepID=A0A1F5VKY1_9BACT|nr:MAG: hypothetical protein A2Y62_18910 [Candidatus Fischerbacteria bacterium RBG_13_37_8]
MKMCLFSLLAFVFILGLFANEKIRQPLLAGSWYEGSQEALNKQLDTFFTRAADNVKETFDEPPLALIVPHAGYIYSGLGAASGYRLLIKHKFERIIILAFSHSSNHSSIAVSDFDAYKTPLGDVPVDTALAKELLKQKEIFETIPSIDQREHSMEIQLPFIKKTAPEAKVLGLYVGTLSDKQFSKAADFLKQYATPKTLFVVSSDFTHYGENYGYVPFPYNDNTKQYLATLDRGAINEILEYNYKGFLQYLKETGATICGRNPITLLSYILQTLNNKNIKGIQANYYTSGDITGDFSNSVSYATLAFYISSKGNKPNFPQLTEENKKFLLKLARDSIAYYFTHKSLMSIDDKKTPLSPALKIVRGAFVTLKINKQLRGCIGHIEPVQELYKDVIENAVNAAFSDPRFQPLTEAELPKVDIDISALTPFTKINNLDEILVGKHGIIIKKGFHQAVFLPQVPVEQGWNKTQYLENLCYKAGLKKDDYLDANLYIFSADVFAEPEFHHK